MTLCVRHVSASGSSLDEGWERNSPHAIEARVRMGAEIVPLLVQVCSVDRPRFGAHPIKRIDEETWLIHPLRYVHTWARGSDALTAVRCPIGDLFTPGDSLLLSNTPPSARAWLEAL